MTTTYHQEKDKVVIERNIDYKPIVEHNKKLYTENNGYSKSKDLKRVASIPTLVLEIWSKEYNGDSNWFALPSDVQKKILKKKLNSSEFQFFRTAPGRL
jgi:Ca2+-dependent lipid-binding protein